MNKKEYKIELALSNPQDFYGLFIGRGDVIGDYSFDGSLECFEITGKVVFTNSRLFSNGSIYQGYIMHDRAEYMMGQETSWRSNLRLRNSWIFDLSLKEDGTVVSINMHGDNYLFPLYMKIGEQTVCRNGIFNSGIKSLIEKSLIKTT